MLLSGYGHLFLIIFFCLICDSNALKCRTGEESQTNEDFEYVVRMCLKQMKNISRNENLQRNINNMFHQDKMRKDQFSRNKNYDYNNYNNNNKNNRNQGDGDGFEYFWGPNSGRDRDRDRDKDRDQNDRGKMDNDYMEDSDYFHLNPFKVTNDNRARARRPHTYQQQIQHDRDSMYGYGHRDSPFSYQKTERNKKRTSNREQKGDSPLEQLDPCMIHCIFQEMQMLDDSGKPDKNIVSEKMSQKIRNPELKAFIQDSIEECFDMIEEEPGNGRNRGSDTMCLWAKNFAVCLEDKGKESCDDWNDPIHQNSNKNRDEQKNKNSKGGNNKG